KPGDTLHLYTGVRWVPTGQEGRVMELRDGGIVSVFGEGGSGNWAVYDYADRFELVNEPVSGRDGPDMEKCRHGSTWIIAGGFWEWCYVCGALRQHVRTGSNSSAPSS